jgi:hypothetical protein
MADANKPDVPGKRAYQPPVLKKVELRPEEAVLGSCKTSSNIGPATSDCLAGTDCFTTGS